MNTLTETKFDNDTASESETDAGSTNTPSVKQATGKQLVAICFIISLATKMFLLPIFLIRATGRDAYIALAVYGGIDLIAMGLMIVAIKISEMNFFELIESVFGRIGAKIAAALVGLFLLFKLNIAVAEILTFYGTNVFTDFDTSLMSIVLLIFLAAAGTHTLRALGRLNELLAPVIAAGLFVLVTIVIMTSVDLANIFPAVRDGRGFCDGLYSHLAWVGDFTPLVMFVGRTKMKKRSGLFAAAGGTLGTAVAVFFALVLSAAFGNVPTLADSTTNLSSILQFTVGKVYGRLDMFASVLWSVSVFIQSALFFYAVCRCVSFVIGKNVHFVISACVCLSVYVVQVFALADPVVFAATTTSAACSAIVPTFAAAVPVLTVICAVICRKRCAAPENTGGKRP